MKIHYKFKSFWILALSLIFVSSVSAQSLESDIDGIVSAMYTADDTGISILVAKDGKTIYKKAFGKANLELDVPMTTDNVFELASITKQFTSVSILMLEEQGKLGLQDPITKFIPDYPTNEKTITVHHLLNHTSGIKSYTDMESFMPTAREDKTVDELIDVFKNEPMDFDPGEKFHYNNSGYIILGKIIEVVSGQTYEEFVEQHIFDKLGMTSSRYGSHKELIKNRAFGYQTEGDGYRNADYLSMSLPYAAGSLMSTVDDMLKWQNALNSNTLIKRSSLEKAINGSILNDGEEISYGYGLSKGDVNGSPGYAHSGGIFGYSTNGIFLKEKNIYVIALTNCSCKNVGEVAEKVAAIANGNPFPNIKDAISLSDDQLQQWVGAYQFDEETLRFVTLEEGKLMSQRNDGEKFEIYPMKEDHFIFEDVTISYYFSVIDGKKQAIFRTGGGEFIGKEVDKAPPAGKVAINLAPEALKKYVGTYELAPTFKIVVTAKEAQLFLQATGQPQFEIFAEAEDKFFLKVVAASIDFVKDENGDVASLVLHQGGQDMPGKKVD